MLCESISLTDDKISRFCEGKFTFLRPNFGNKSVGSNTVNLRIDDAYLRLEAIVALNLATANHLLRESCNPKTSFLLRLIAARTLLEVLFACLYVVSILKKLAVDIEHSNDLDVVNKIEEKRDLLSRAMLGSRSPYTSDEFPNGIHIDDCRRYLKKMNTIDNFEDLENLYDHLCDYTHPNYSMKSIFSEVLPASGDNFSYEIKIDPTFSGIEKSQAHFHHLMNSLEFSAGLVDRILEDKELAKAAFNRRNVKNKNKYAFNSVTCK